jgi:hypothetical protein
MAEPNHHNHEPNPATCDVKYGTWMMKSAARSTAETVSEIVSESLNLIPEASQGSLTKISSIKRVIRKARNTVGVPRANFDSWEGIPCLASHFLLPVVNSVEQPENFVVLGSGPRRDWIADCSTTSNLNWL